MFVYFPMQKRAFDWKYFDSLALVLKSSVWQYGTIPLHNPWSCSGLSLLSNPQNWIFSPLFLFTLLFPVTLGNILSVLVLKIFGFWGAVKYLSHLRVSTEITYFGAALFINSNWFSLHFSEGHIPFRTFFLLPWVFLWSETLCNRKVLLKIGLLLSFMILDGGIYPAIFSTIYVVFFFLTSPNRLKEFCYYVKKNIWYFLSLILICILLVMPKIFPVMMNSTAVSEVQEHQSVTPTLFFHIFFNPFLNNHYNVEGYLRFHEYGNYFGVSVTILLLICILSLRKIDRELTQRFLLMVLFLWIAMGWGHDFNPYKIISSIPFIKKAHVHTRYLIVFNLIFISLFSMLLTKLKFKKLTYGFFTIALIETLVANYYSFTSVGTNYDLPLIKRETWKQTQTYVQYPDIYYSDGLVSRLCYEPSSVASKTKAYSDPGYTGEVSLLSGDAKVSALKLTPGEILFTYFSNNGAEILLNTNHLDGWIETNGLGEPFSFNSLLAIRVPPGQGPIRLQYLPDYYIFIIVSCISGLIGLLLIRKKTHEL